MLDPLTSPADVDGAGTTMTVNMVCGASCFQFSGIDTTGAVSNMYWFDNPANCSGLPGALTGFHLALKSFVCSPLNIVWQFSNVAQITTFTLTL